MSNLEKYVNDHFNGSKEVLEILTDIKINISEIYGLITGSQYDIEHLINVFIGYRETFINHYSNSNCCDNSRFPPGSAQDISYESGKSLFFYDKILADKANKFFNEMKNTYKDEKFCDHCQKETLHFFRDSNHERDSSGDYFECLECHWYGTGIDRIYSPPYNEYD